MTPSCTLGHHPTLQPCQSLTMPFSLPSLRLLIPRCSPIWTSQPLPASLDPRGEELEESVPCSYYHYSVHYVRCDFHVPPLSRDRAPAGQKQVSLSPLAKRYLGMKGKVLREKGSDVTHIWDQTFPVSSYRIFLNLGFFTSELGTVMSTLGHFEN